MLLNLKNLISTNNFKSIKKQCTYLIENYENFRQKTL